MRPLSMIQPVTLFFALLVAFNLFGHAAASGDLVQGQPNRMIKRYAVHPRGDTPAPDIASVFGVGSSPPAGSASTSPAAGSPSGGSTSPTSGAGSTSPSSGAPGSTTSPGTSPTVSPPGNPLGSVISGALGTGSDSGSTSGTTSASATNTTSSTATTTNSTTAAPTQTTPPTPVTPLSTFNSSSSAIVASFTSTPYVPPTPLTSTQIQKDSNQSRLSSNTIHIMIGIASAIAGAGLIWTIIRKWKFRPSSNFEDRLAPIDWQPSVEPDMAQRHRFSIGARSQASGSGNDAASVRRNMFAPDDAPPAHDFTAGPAISRAPTGAQYGYGNRGY